MRVVIIDDEPLARAHLRKMLLAHHAEIAGEGESGIDALKLAEEHQPELIFLDIEMPDLTGMQAVAALNTLEPRPLVVFVTGYSQHAAEAFEHAAFDYLLKPVGPERLALTLSRAAQSKRANAAPPPVVEPLTPAARLPIRTDYAIKLIRIEEVRCAIAKDKKVAVHTASGDFKTYYSLSQLEQLLPAEEFMRIHASVLVRLSEVEELHFLGNHSYSVRLSDGLNLPVGRSLFAPLQKRLGLSK